MTVFAFDRVNIPWSSTARSARPGSTRNLPGRTLSLNLVEISREREAARMKEWDEPFADIQPQGSVKGAEKEIQRSYPWNGRPIREWGSYVKKARQK